jgi:hypothetical protein
MVDDDELKVEYDPRGGILAQGVVMVRRLLASVFLAAFPVVVIPIAVTSMGVRAGAAPPTAVQQCKDGGWQTLTDASGQPFKNQGQCISYFIHNPVGLSDLAGSLTGTASLIGGPPGGGCSFLEMTFDATYPGSSAVGTVTLQMGGCVSVAFPPAPIPFGPGGFAFTTNVGTLNGTAAGPITTAFAPNGALFPASATLTLTTTSGTGQFTGMTGTLNVNLQWPEPGSLSFIGTVTPA